MLHKILLLVSIAGIVLSSPASGLTTVETIRDIAAGKTAARIHGTPTYSSGTPSHAGNQGKPYTFGLVNALINESPAIQTVGSRNSISI
jgi:hypothetical protein